MEVRGSPVYATSEFFASFAHQLHLRQIPRVANHRRSHQPWYESYDRRSLWLYYTKSQQTYSRVK